MDIKLLRTFVAVADCLHFGEAARRLHLTQPAITKQIRQLEASLGAVLLQRGRHGAALTSFGQFFVEEARQLVQQADQLARQARRVAKGEVGQLAIGFGLSGLEVVPRMVAAFRNAYPEVEVSLEDMASSEQVELLLSGKLQLGFMRLPVAAPLSSRVLLTDRLVMVAGEPWGGALGLGELPQLPMVALRRHRGPGLAAQIDRLLALHGVQQTVIQEADDILTVLALVAAGIGAALVPQSAMAIIPSGVRVASIDSEAASWQLGLVWHPEHDSAPKDNFLRLVPPSWREQLARG
ncbi:LysR family transcriptional regulator [Neisseriaceae bacterium JH1-16]|nr:LysR family transcriptional regulator [Neisseriaceae bacterium JH1-16]